MFKPILFLCALGVTAPLALGKDQGKVLVLHLSAHGDDISFDKKLLEQPYTPEVSIKFINEASHGSQILHNVAILRPGSTEAVVAELQKQSYNIEALRKHKDVLVMTRALNPGESETVSFRPEAKGEYPYICLMAGHGDILGMKGILHLK